MIEKTHSFKHSIAILKVKIKKQNDEQIYTKNCAKH